MLDDANYIKNLDAQNALGTAATEYEQLDYEFALQPMDFQPANVVYAGMGGSALAAHISSSWPGYKVPFEIVRGYDIPAYVSNETLFIAASNSGNTEETLSALAQAEERGAHIAIIAGGGKLVEIAQAKNYPLTLLPPAGQPRYAVFYNLKALLALLRAANLVTDVETLLPLKTAAEFLARETKKWLPDTPSDKNQAKQLAKELMGKSAVVYSGPKLFPAAYKWKISVNENAKQVAWCNYFPEYNHNEFIGWSQQPTEKPYAVVELRSNLEHPRVQKRFEVSERLLSGMRPIPLVVNAEGDNLLEQLLWTILFGDFVSIYLALLNGINPSPVDLVEKLKAEMAK